jgi:hypothetical protein
MKIRKLREDKDINIRNSNVVDSNYDIYKNVIDDLTSESTDPFGSYTGNCIDPYEKPVQDADDL